AQATQERARFVGGEGVVGELEHRSDRSPGFGATHALQTARMRTMNLVRAVRARAFGATFIGSGAREVDTRVGSVCDHCRRSPRSSRNRLMPRSTPTVVASWLSA